jgi:hypothetical protein
MIGEDISGFCLGTLITLILLILFFGFFIKGQEDKSKYIRLYLPPII